MKEEYNDNELIAVPIGEKWGYINLKGEVVIPPQYDSATLFYDGIAEVRIDGKYGFINKKNEIVSPLMEPQNLYEYSKKIDNKTPHSYRRLRELGDGIWLISEKEDWNYFRKGLSFEDTIIVEPQFDKIEKCGNGFVLHDGDEMGLANKKGIVKYPQYNELTSVFDDVFMVVYYMIDDDMIDITKRYGLVDINGNTMAPVIYESPFYEHYEACGVGYELQFITNRLNGHLVYFNNKGEKIWEDESGVIGRMNPV